MAGHGIFIFGRAGVVIPAMIYKSLGDVMIVKDLFHGELAWFEISVNNIWRKLTYMYIIQQKYMYTNLSLCVVLTMTFFWCKLWC